MKYIKLYIMALATMFMFSCSDTEQDDLVTENATNGGLITAPSKSLNYVVGDGASYDFPLIVHQNADNDVSEVKLYKSASIAKLELVETIITMDTLIDVMGMDSIITTTEEFFENVWYPTNEILVETLDVPGSINTTIQSGSYDYAALTNGLTLNGAALPAADSELTIGDRFIFRIESILTDGSIVEQSYKINVAVSTRFAGTYNCDAMEYYRINALSTYNWSGETIVIESVDATTYKYTEWAPVFGAPQEFYFQVDASNNITFPLEYGGAVQVLNGQPLMNCDSNPMDFGSVDCGVSNIVIKDDVNGKDQLLITYGYFTAGSGPREFQETLTKK